MRLNGKGEPEVVNLNGIKEDDLLFHDESAKEPGHAFKLARMRWPEMPEPMGVFRSIHKHSYDQEVAEQVEQATAKNGPGSLEELFHSGDTWEVK